MFPMYKLGEMLVTQWFDMLSTKDDQEEPTHVYVLEASENFVLDGQAKVAGTYYLRTEKEDIEGLKAFCTVSKLSFSDMVYLSDIFSRAIPTGLPTDDEMKKLAEKGEAFHYLEKDIASTEGLESLSLKIGPKYFDNSLMGVVRRIFSALNNLFKKYNLYLETGIYWPGDSCTYASKVVSQIDRIKQVFAKTALEASKEILSSRLEISLDELEAMEFDQLKKLYRKKVLAVHPDKNNDPLAKDKFKEINQVWGDYNQLVKFTAKLIEPKFIEDGDIEIELPKEMGAEANLPPPPQEEVRLHSMADID